MTALWKVLAAAVLLHALLSCVPVAGADPLIITVAKDGSDEVACLKGQIACNTFQYACAVDGNGGDVTMVITYSQVLLYAQDTKIGLDIRNLKLIGEAKDGYTFICSGLAGGLSIQSSGQLEQIWLENIRLLCVGELSISDFKSVYLKGYVGQGLTLYIATGTVNVEDSTFVYVSGDKSIIHIPTPAGGDSNVSVTLKNSSVIHKNKTGNPLSVKVNGGGNFDIFIENTNFTLTQPPSPDQPAAMQVNFDVYHDYFSNNAVSMNFTISKCNFFNYNSTGLEVVMKDGTFVAEMYLSIVGSKFFVPWDSKYGRPIMSSSGISVTQGWREEVWGGYANVHTRIEGNTFGSTSTD